MKNMTHTGNTTPTETMKRPNHRPPKKKAVNAADLNRSFFTVAEVATMMQLNESTVRRMLQRGELIGKKYGKLWRIRVEDLERFTSPDTL